MLCLLTGLGGSCKANIIKKNKRAIKKKIGSIWKLVLKVQTKTYSLTSKQLDRQTGLPDKIRSRGIPATTFFIMSCLTVAGKLECFISSGPVPCPVCVPINWTTTVMLASTRTFMRAKHWCPSFLDGRSVLVDLFIPLRQQVKYCKFPETNEPERERERERDRLSRS